MTYEIKTSLELESFLAHYGVKGMRWGQKKAAKAVSAANERAKNPNRYGNRNNALKQEEFDVVRRVASGKGSIGDKMSVGYNVATSYNVVSFLAGGASLKNISRKELLKAQDFQKQVVSGKRRADDKLNRLFGVDVRELDFSIPE